MTPGDILDTETARSMLPGLARCAHTPAPPAPVVPRAVLPADIDDELVLLHLVLALARAAAKLLAADRAFIAGLRGKRVQNMSGSERERLIAAQWTYRAHLPAGLRPVVQPKREIAG